MGVLSPVIAPALRGRDPYPEFDNVRVFRGRPETGGRQLYKAGGLIVPRFEMVSGVQIVGGAGFGQREISGAWRGARADEPLIGDGGLRNAEARTNIWPTNDASSPGSTWPTTTAANRSAGTIPSHIAGAVPVLTTTTGTNGRLQRNIGLLNDSLVRTYTVWVERKANTYQVSVGAVGGVGIAASVFFDGLSGVVSSGAPGATVIADGDYWRVDVPLTNNSSGNNLIYGFVQLTGGSGLTANLLCPMITVGPSILGPPIVTTGLPATRTDYSYRETGLSIAPVHYGLARARLLAPLANHAASLPIFLDLRPDTVSSRVLWFANKSVGNHRIIGAGSNGVSAEVSAAAAVAGQYYALAWACRAGSMAYSLDGGAVNSFAVSAITSPFTRVGYMGDAATPAANTSNAETEFVFTRDGEISDAALQALSARFAA